MGMGKRPGGGLSSSGDDSQTAPSSYDDSHRLARSLHPHPVGPNAQDPGGPRAGPRRRSVTALVFHRHPSYPGTRPAAGGWMVVDGRKYPQEGVEERGRWPRSGGW